MMFANGFMQDERCVRGRANVGAFERFFFPAVGMCYKKN